MPRDRYVKKYSTTIINTGPITSPPQYHEAKTKLARQMARSGATFSEIKKAVGLEDKSRDYFWKWLHQRGIYNVARDPHPPPKPLSEEALASKAEKMRIWHSQEHPETQRAMNQIKPKPDTITGAASPPPTLFATRPRRPLSWSTASSCVTPSGMMMLVR
jgi:hypothetical protein